MSLLIQLAINGLIAGSIYALVACGFSLIYATNRFMHFAHGSSVVVAAYALFTLFSTFQVPFWLACILTIMIAGLFGLLVNHIIYMPLQKKKSSNVVLLIASVGVMILMENSILLAFGAETKTIGYITETTNIQGGGAIITPLQIVLVGVSLLLFFLLYIIMKKTTVGRNMRAVADNKDLAKIMGINTRHVADYSFIIGSALAGIAGILIALEQNINPLMGTKLMIKGFTGAVIGGMSSVPASIIGSFILGIAENMGIWYLPSRYKDAIAFGLLFLFLLFKPSGLFGLNKGVKQ